MADSFATDVVSKESTTRTLSPSVLLRQAWADRRRKNPRYSLRAFARTLGIPAGRLSELLSGKRAFTRAHVERIAEALMLSPDAARGLLAAWISERDIVALEQPVEAKIQLSDDIFAVIAEWPHFAILSLLHTRDFKPDAKWIARRLAIPAPIVRTCVDRLERTGLLVRDGRRWTRSHRALCTSTDLQSIALKLSHRQSLEQAIDSLETTPLLLRDVTSNTMAIDPAKLPEAKRLIQQFHAAMETLLETGHRSEVYNLNIQLVPVSKRSFDREGNA